jgi:mono/diheme cytochrome c family protein
MRMLLGMPAGLGAVVLAGLVSAQNVASIEPSPEAGAEIAARWCAGCHVVSKSGAGTDAAPSFPSIATRREETELRVFLSKPHAQAMRGFTLTRREVEDVVAYIQSLD